MLLLAPDLLGESLALKLTSAREEWEVVLRPERLTGAPALVIWSIDSVCLLYTSPSPRDGLLSRMPSSA
jgi:hypothetical protein